jgi:hypothetical protein
MHYKSSKTLLGLPLVHVAIGSPDGSRAGRGIAKGWVAVGDISFGIVLSVGGLAIGSNANTDAARAYFEASKFFSVAMLAARHSRWLLLLAVIVPISAVFFKSRSGPST